MTACATHGTAGDDGASLAKPADGVLLVNLLELYIHDLSDICSHVQFDADGRFGFRSLALSWTESGRRFPFLIAPGDEIAGSPWLRAGSRPAQTPTFTTSPSSFLLRRQRRAGVGRAAARLLWGELPGCWMVREMAANSVGLAFWSQRHPRFHERWRSALAAQRRGARLAGRRVRGRRATPRRVRRRPSATRAAPG